MILPTPIDYDDLLDRMSADGNESLDRTERLRIASHARRQAEKLADPEGIQVLAQALSSDDKHRRWSAAFAIKWIGRNNSSANDEAFRALYARIGLEKDAHTLGFHLDHMGALRHPGDVDIQPLLDLIDSKRWPVRSGAIRALCGAVGPNRRRVEDAMIRVIETTDKPFMFMYATGALNAVGTQKCLPALEKAAAYKGKHVRDVRMGAESVMRAIRVRAGLPPE